MYKSTYSHIKVCLDICMESKNKLETFARVVE